MTQGVFEQMKNLVYQSEPNPCIFWFGKGPAGALCKTCANLIKHEYNKIFYKCLKRGITHGPGTDHRVRWNACGKYKAQAGGEG